MSKKFTVAPSVRASELRDFADYVLDVHTPEQLNNVSDDYGLDGREINVRLETGEIYNINAPNAFDHVETLYGAEWRIVGFRWIPGHEGMSGEWRG